MHEVCRGLGFLSETHVPGEDIFFFSFEKQILSLYYFID